MREFLFIFALEQSPFSTTAVDEYRKRGTPLQKKSLHLHRDERSDYDTRAGILIEIPQLRLAHLTTDFEQAINDAIILNP